MVKNLLCLAIAMFSHCRIKQFAGHLKQAENLHVHNLQYI